MHFHNAFQLESIRRDTEDRILQRGISIGFAGQVQELSSVGSINIVGRDRDYRATTLLQCLVLFDRSALVPEQQREGDNQQDKTGQDTLDGPRLCARTTTPV